MSWRRPRIDGLKALGITASAAVILLAASLAALTAGIDRRSADFEESLVRLGYVQVVAQARGVIETNAIWDAALMHNTPAVDGAWVKDNVVTNSPWDPMSGIVLVFEHDDTLPFASEHDQTIPPARRNAIRRAMAPVLTRLRQREAETAPMRRHKGLLNNDERVTVTTTVIVQGVAYVAIVYRIDSASGNVARPERAPVLAVLVPVQEKILPGLAASLRLSGLALTIGGGATGASSTPLTDVDDRTVAVLSWRPRRPGTDLVAGALPVITLAVAVLGVAVLLAYRRGNATAAALAESEARASHLAFHDQLTGLPNRRLMTDCLAASVARVVESGAPLTLLALDLDDFKLVNDTYGHPCGDGLIQAIGARLAQSCRTGDVCARLGGDEFIMLLPDCEPDQARRLADRLIGVVCAPVCLPAATVRVGVLIGISTMPALANGEEELIRQADVALYCAKAQPGSAACFFDPGMDEAQRNERRLEEDFRAALRDCTVRVAYQPQFRRGVLVGVEALARWTHPARGAVPPACFVPLAERCGLIEALGWQVTARAFADARRWPGLRIGINLSAVQIRAADFLPRLATLMAECAIRPAQFEFEITETVLMEEDQALERTLAGLRRMGFGLALDDFGTGYCSLSYLRRFPITRIKIDRSFVSPLPSDDGAERLVGAIIHLARTLELAVIAEGVETVGQRDSLATLGCDEFQGYLGGAPVAAEDIDGILTAPLYGGQPAGRGGCAIPPRPPVIMLNEA